ncbi:hypothetical protein J6590_001875 [Homalodisca vitripennis]|nr:hypothetical protein J6590_001875 [Homalodisca vitripennis]
MQIRVIKLATNFFSPQITENLISYRRDLWTQRRRRTDKVISGVMSINSQNMQEGRTGRKSRVIAICWAALDSNQLVRDVQPRYCATGSPSARVLQLY